jgi:SM-20-related protein
MLKIPKQDWGAAGRALTTHGFAVLPAALPEGGWRGLRAEAERLRADDAFSEARVGRGEGLQSASATRGGSVCWLGAGMPAGDAFLAWMDGLRVSLNRDLFLGIETFEAQYAHYPVGASYGTHVDRHRDSDARVVSAVVYLNPDWPTNAGGELVIYDGHDEHDGQARHSAPRLTLAPEGGTLVLFMSDDTPHEAKKATRERWSIAGWFRTRH